MGSRRQTRDAIPKVAIFGCGRIGSALDEAGGTHVLTHAAACSKTPGLELSALCDPDPERLTQAGEARGIDALYTEPEALLAEHAIDIAVIATPTELRTPLIKQALASGVRFFVLEKPLAKDMKEALSLAALLRAHQARVVLNYLRRFSAGLISARECLRRGDFGLPQVATLHYGKGLNNNGSHAIDLVRWWLGEPTKVKVLGRVADERREDPTLHCVYELITHSGTPILVHLIGVDHRDVSIFELDLICSEGRVRVCERGARVETSLIVEDPTFTGYSALSEATHTPGGVEHALEGLWTHVQELIHDDQSASRSSLADGLATLSIVESSLEAWQRGGEATIDTSELRS